MGPLPPPTPTCTALGYCPLAPPTPLSPFQSLQLPPLTHLHPSTPGCHSRAAGPGLGCSWGSWQGQRKAVVLRPRAPLPASLPLPAPTCCQESPPPEGWSHPGSDVLLWKLPGGSGAGEAGRPPAGLPGEDGKGHAPGVTVAQRTLLPLPPLDTHPGLEQTCHLLPLYPSLSSQMPDQCYHLAVPNFRISWSNKRFKKIFLKEDVCRKNQNGHDRVSIFFASGWEGGLKHTFPLAIMIPKKFLTKENIRDTISQQRMVFLQNKFCSTKD